ncbi:hypothetical protein J2785_004493 [Burkholderia ambifaria]|nr:hypothetical protein [Burkholderia ambifaria]MDR6501320.1 hypothetical protein [Burkholderia ambifaria]
MASILKIGDRWRAQVRRRGQSIAKTFRTKGAAEAWAREIEGGIVTVSTASLARRHCNIESNHFPVAKVSDKKQVAACTETSSPAAQSP